MAVLSASPVTVRGGVWHDGRIAGKGFVGGGVRVEFAGGISPGNGANSPGTLTISNGVVEAGGAVNCFDLSDDPAGATRTNDLLNVIGNLTLSGTNEFAFNLLNTNLPPGVYPLIAYSGTFNGALASQTISGLDGLPVALTNPPGQIALLVKSARAPATLTWTGGLNGNAWDLLTTSNWLNGAARDQFNPQDIVRFDNAGAANPTVALAGLLNAGGVVVDSTSNYTFKGSGVLMGSGGLVQVQHRHAGHQQHGLHVHRSDDHCGGRALGDEVERSRPTQFDRRFQRGRDQPRDGRRHAATHRRRCLHRSHDHSEQRHEHLRYPIEFRADDPGQPGLRRGQAGQDGPGFAPAQCEQQLRRRHGL